MFGGVIVEIDPAVVEEQRETAPAVERVADRLAELAPAAERAAPER